MFHCNVNDHTKALKELHSVHMYILCKQVRHQYSSKIRNVYHMKQILKEVMKIVEVTLLLQDKHPDVLM